MASFIRPEIQALGWKWRESLFGTAMALTGLWWAFVTGGLLGYLGIVAICTGAALAFVGLQRGRFRSGGGSGLGSVDVDEGQVTYFGPLTGGVMPLREMDCLALIRSGQSPHWRLSSGQNTLHIPMDAAGADALFDAFASLPGLNTQRMLRVLKDATAQDTVIWQKTHQTPPVLHS